jgi:hypothetical protein
MAFLSIAPAGVHGGGGGVHHFRGAGAAADTGAVCQTGGGAAKMYGGQSTHLPLKINTSGVIPPIFASSIIMFPATIASFINDPLDAERRRCHDPGKPVL